MAIDKKVRTYSPGQVEVTYGDIIFTAFAEGSHVTIERNGQVFEKKKGADGTITRINKNAFDFTVTVRLEQASITNDDLSTVLNSDIINNDGVKPFSVKDINGNSYFYAESAWISQDPNDEFGDTLGEREWKFDTGPADKFTGGNVVINEE